MIDRENKEVSAIYMFVDKLWDFVKPIAKYNVIV